MSAKIKATRGPQNPPPRRTAAAETEPSRTRSTQTETEPNQTRSTRPSPEASSNEQNAQPNAQNAQPPNRFQISYKTSEEIKTRFTYHAPKDDQPERYGAVRDKAKELATLIAQTSHESREQAQAMTHLETAVMFANAAIARHA